MSDTLEGRPPLTPTANEATKPRLTFGVDSAPPIEKPLSEAAAKAAGSHGYVPKTPQAAPMPADLVLEIQDLTQPAESPIASTVEPDSQTKTNSQGFERPLQPGDPFRIKRGQVLYDSDGKEIGTYDHDISDHEFVRYIRRPNSAPLIVHKDKQGNEIITKMIGSSKVMGSK